MGVGQGGTEKCRGSGICNQDIVYEKKNYFSYKKNKESICISVYVCVGAWSCHGAWCRWRPEEGAGFPKAGVIGSCEPLVTGDWNCTRILCKRNINIGS